MGFLKKLKEKILGKKNEDEVVEALKESNLKTYKKGLKKTKKSVTKKLAKLSSEKITLDDNYFEKLEEILIEADIHFNTVGKLILGIKKELLKIKLKIVLKLMIWFLKKSIIFTAKQTLI